MRRLIPAALLLAFIGVALFANAQQGSAKTPRAPNGFFGIGPQTSLTEEDAQYMRVGGIDTVRWPVAWSAVQPTRNGGYHWESVDEAVAVAARRGLTILPFFVDTPRWISRKPTTLPVNNGQARQAWSAFLKAAVKRYGPGGEFWNERAPGVVQYALAVNRPRPIRDWQIWNEANFFYFAFPASPQRYAKLVKISSAAIKSVDRRARVILGGLFGEPKVRRPKGMPATEFLAALYRTPGIKSRFDGIALHPYAVDAETLEELVEELHEVTVENRDPVALYITEMGWGSQNNFRQVAFEQGVQGQVRQLKDSYRYLLENRRRLRLKQVYWFSWKDIPGACSFCDSVGLFHQGPKFKPKPAWRAFVAITRGRVRP
jgi:Beta-galactosidase